MFRYSFVGAIYSNLILNRIIFSAEKAFTLTECLSVTLSLTQSPIPMRLLMLSLIFTASHCLLNVTSGLLWLWNGLNNDKCGLFSSNYHKHNNSFVQISFFVYSYILSWLILRKYTRSSLWSCTFINHFLKHKEVSNLCRALKTYLWES